MTAAWLAVDPAPDNGQYCYWLAQGYISQGRFDEAIKRLMLARDTLPANIGLTPDMVDGAISRAALAAGSRDSGDGAPIRAACE